MIEQQKKERVVKFFSKQYDAFCFSTQFGAVVCGSQSGKTFLGAHWAGKKITEFPENNGAIIAPCYSDDTEILTDKGWKLFKDLKEEKVACLVDNKIKFNKPTEKYEWDFDGQMIGLKHSQIDLLVTPNHRLYFKDAYGKNKEWRIKLAGDVFGKRIKLKRWAEWKEGKKQNKDWYEFLGFWFAEGYAEFNTKARKYRIVITQKKNVRYVDDLLKRIGVKFYKDKRQNGGFNWTIYNKELAREFVKYGKALTKHIPEEIKNADTDSLKALVKGYEMGDGKTSEKQRILYTSSKVLADDLQEIGNKCGYAISIRKYDYKKWDNPQYLVSILKHYGKEPVIYKKQWYKKKYNGKVYCVKIGKGEGVLLVRRNGISVWCGNTYKILQHATMEKFFQIFPELRRYYKEQKGEIVLPTGGKVFVRSADSPLGIEGMTLHWWWFDEAGMAPRLSWVVLRTRVSMTGGQGMITTTPHNMGWLYQEYYIPWKDKIDDQLSFFTWKSIENKHFSKEFYEAEKRRLRPEEFARRYEGRFEKMEGLVYELPDEQIVDYPEDIESFTKKAEARIMGIDWGWNNPAAIGVYYLFDKKWYVIDEWKRPQKTTAQIIQIAEKMKQEHRVKFIYPDPAEPDRIEEFKNKGLFVEEVNKDLKGGISYIQQQIREKKFFICRNCHEHIDEINSYHYPEIVDEKPIKDEPFKLNDHLMDAMRYAIFNYPRESIFKVPQRATEALPKFYPEIGY